MKILCESGIVDSRQDGKWIHYKISENGSSFAVELLKKLQVRILLWQQMNVSRFNASRGWFL